jgi:hypothetical protein
MAQSEFLELGGQDAYQVLGLTPLASPDEIRTARRTRQMAVHPDRHGDAEQSKLVNYAAQILLDDETRRDYDQFRTQNWLGAPRPRAQDQPACEPPSGQWRPPWAPSGQGPPEPTARAFWPAPPPAPMARSPMTQPPTAGAPMATEYGPEAPRGQSAGSTVFVALALLAALAFCIGCSPWGRVVTDLFGR